jgi:small-conductance mechanosensitive channel
MLEECTAYQCQFAGRYQQDFQIFPVDSKRVLGLPEPAVRLMEFADSGIALELRVWMSDPEEGLGECSFGY